MGIPLLRGRDFTERDGEEAPPVVIIDEAFANRHFPNEDPVGQRIAFGDPDQPTWSEVIGIVGHVKLNGVAEEAGIQLYMPYMQGAYAPITLMLQTSGDPAQVVSALRNEMMALDPQLPVYGVRMMDDLLEDTVATRRLAMNLLTAFAFLALVLVSVGIYGVMAYTASARTHEMGIRMALGARPTFVVGLVVRQGMALALAGLVIGTAVAFGLTHLMESMLFGVEPNDPMTFVAIPIILALVALAASYIPARRASRADPLAALRHQ
jgi:putative ABC transport system permease protein